MSATRLATTLTVLEKSLLASVLSATTAATADTSGDGDASGGRNIGGPSGSSGTVGVVVENERCGDQGSRCAAFLAQLLREQTRLAHVPGDVPLVELGLDSIAAMVLRQKLLAGLRAIASSSSAAAAVTTAARLGMEGKVAEDGADGADGPGTCPPPPSPPSVQSSAAEDGAAFAGTAGSTTTTTTTTTATTAATAPRYKPLALDFAEFDELTATVLRARVVMWGQAPLVTDAAPRPVVQTTAPKLKAKFQTTGKAWPDCGNPECLPIPERDGRTPDCQISRQGGISCCATGHLEGLKMLVEAGWDSVRPCAEPVFSSPSSPSLSVCVDLPLTPRHSTLALSTFASCCLPALHPCVWWAGVARIPLPSHTPPPKIRCKVHAVDRKLSTALHWAAGNGHLSVVAFLLPLLPKGHADRRNKQGRTALMHAAKNGHLPVVKLLVEGRPDVAWEDRASVHIRMKDGSSVFDW